MASPGPTYSERPNALTEDIDVASPESMVRLLRQVDAQMFSGFDGKEGLMDEAVLREMVAVAVRCSDCLQRGGHVILSGSGTSGRLAHLLSRAFSLLLVEAEGGHGGETGEAGADAAQRKPRGCFKYFNAGGDTALFKSMEAPEDNWAAAQAALPLLLPADDSVPVVFVGITCGLSAPAVAVQLEMCLARPNTTTVLLGFSPPALARRTAMEGLGKSFYDVVQAMLAKRRGSESGGIASDASAAARGAGDTEKKSKEPTFYPIHDSTNIFFLTPVVGPEGITGSTRMKGGSATKIMLEAIFASALAHMAAGTAPTMESMFTLLRQYEGVVRETYFNIPPVAQAIVEAGSCLSQFGRVLYLAQDTFGILSLIDASECPPTFSACREDVRAFVADGYATLRNAEGDMTSHGHYFELSWDDFQRKDYQSSLSSLDTVVVMDGAASSSAHRARMQQLIATAIKSEARVVYLLVDNCDSHTFARHQEILDLAAASLPPPSPTSPPPGSSITFIPVRLSSSALSLSGLSPHNTFLAELAAKLVLNAITTGAHILKGKVLKNRMIDLQVSNSKLFIRAIGIVATFSLVPEADARVALLRAIHRVDVVTDEIERLPVSAHVAAATRRADEGMRAVPLAVVLALRPRLGCEEAWRRIVATPIVRQLLADLEAEQR